MVICLYKVEKIIGNPNFSNLFKLTVKRIQTWGGGGGGVNLDSMRRNACLVFSPIMVESDAALFGCTSVVQVSDSRMASTFCN